MSARTSAPPADLDQERLVIGCALLNEKKWFADAYDLKPQDLEFPAWRKLLGLIQEHLTTGKPVTLPALGATLRDRGQEELIGRLAEAGDSVVSVHTQDLGFAVRRLRDLAHLRRLHAALTRAPSLLTDPELEHEEKLQQVANSIFAALETNERMKMGTTEVLGDEVLDLAIKRREQRESGGSSLGVPTGIREIDEQNGGFLPGTLIVLAARTSYGKTTEGRSLVAHAAESGRSVLILALEASRLEFFLSLLQGRTGIRPIEAREGLVQQEYLAEEIERIRELPIVIESGRFDLPTMLTLIRRARLVHGTELVVVDYVQLVQHQPRGQTRATALGDVSAALKGLAMELEIAILVLAQLNRGPEEREGGKPRISDVRESESIAHDADLVMFLVRPDLRNESGLPYLMIAKNRHGPTADRIPLEYSQELDRYAPSNLRLMDTGA